MWDLAVDSAWFVHCATSGQDLDLSFTGCISTPRSSPRSSPKRHDYQIDQALLRNEVEQIFETIASLELSLTDNRLQLRPDKPNGRPLHRLHQFYNLTTDTFAFVSHNLRQSERILSLQRMQFRLLQLLDHTDVALHSSSFEQAFEIRPVAYDQVSVLDDHQSYIAQGAFSRSFENVETQDT